MRESLSAAGDVQMNEDNSNTNRSGIRELQISMGSNFADLFEYFVEDMRAYHEQLVQAFEANRFDEGRRIAHTVKSTSLLFGGSEISQQAKDLEDAFVSGDRLPEKLTLLHQSMTHHVEQLKLMLISN
jgi:HPt (histidine-containing phosphotransfer) domain-containing protein